MLPVLMMFWREIWGSADVKSVDLMICIGVSKKNMYRYYM